eukprot:158143-Prymnesium_polylepis.1
MSQTPLGVGVAQGGVMSQTPLGDGGLNRMMGVSEHSHRSWGRLSRHSNHHLLTWSLRDLPLHGFDREVVSEDRGRSRGDGFVWVCH